LEHLLPPYLVVAADTLLCFPDEFDVTALAAENPREAITMALARRTNDTYAREQFRADVMRCYNARQLRKRKHPRYPAPLATMI
jgi:hypothetical protein